MDKPLVRLADESDAKQLAEWIQQTPNNCFDPDIAKYPSFRGLAVNRNNKTRLYVPFHPVIAVESLAHDPTISAKENAICLAAAQRALDEIAVKHGIAEIWWQCRDESLIKLASKHGYEVLKDSTTLRKKLCKS